MEDADLATLVLKLFLNLIRLVCTSIFYDDCVYGCVTVECCTLLISSNCYMCLMLVFKISCDMLDMMMMMMMMISDGDGDGDGIVDLMLRRCYI